MSERAERSGKLITAFGPPSAYTQFCLFVLHHLLSATLKEFDHVCASEIQHLRTAWGLRRHSSFLLFSDCPERSIVEIYLDTKAPIVLFIEDPEEVARHVIRERGLETSWAVRLAEQSLTTLSDLFQSDGALIIPRESRVTLSHFLVSLSEHFKLPYDDQTILSVAATLARGDAGALSMTIDELCRRHGPTLSVEDRIANRRSLAQFGPLFARLRRIPEGPTEEIDWPVFMFVSSDEPSICFDGQVDFVGPARCLVYGPYMCLPCGKWGLRASIAISGNKSGNELDADVYQQDVLVSSRFQLPPEGELEIQARFEVTEPRIPVQLRLMTTQGAIEGSMLVRSVSLFRLAHPSR